MSYSILRIFFVGDKDKPAETFIAGTVADETEKREDLKGNGQVRRIEVYRHQFDVLAETVFREAPYSPPPVERPVTLQGEQK